MERAILLTRVLRGGVFAGSRSPECPASGSRGRNGLRSPPAQCAPRAASPTAAPCTEPPGRARCPSATLERLCDSMRSSRRPWVHRRSGSPAIISRRRFLAASAVGGPALAAALALVLAAGQAAACARPRGRPGGGVRPSAGLDRRRENRRRAMDGMVAVGTRRHPGGRAFFHPFPSVRAAGRPGRGARLDAGPPARHELPARGDPERLVRNGRRPDVPHAGALAADSGCPRRGGRGRRAPMPSRVSKAVAVWRRRFQRNTNSSR